jgi:hypothetical protein
MRGLHVCADRCDGESAPQERVVDALRGGLIPVRWIEDIHPELCGVGTEGVLPGRKDSDEHSAQDQLAE